MMETLRHELKFKIAPLEAKILQNKLHCLMDYDAYGQDGVYHIRSLYFDDLYDTALREKLDGVDKASKYRMRIYNGNASGIKLERKHKKGEIVDKKSFSIDPEGYRLFLSDPRRFADAFPELHTRRLKPKNIIAYDRTAFVYEPSHVRITFDRNIRTTVNFSPCLLKPCNFISIQPSHQVVLEIKYTGVFPSHFKWIFNEALAGQSISKYAMGRMLGFN